MVLCVQNKLKCYKRFRNYLLIFSSKQIILRVTVTAILIDPRWSEWKTDDRYRFKSNLHIKRTSGIPGIISDPRPFERKLVSSLIETSGGVSPIKQNLLQRCWDYSLVISDRRAHIQHKHFRVDIHTVLPEVPDVIADRAV